MFDGEIFESLEFGDFYGEEISVFNTPIGFHLHVEEDAEIYTVAANSLKDIPVIRWKLLEAYERRRR